MTEKKISFFPFAYINLSTFCALFIKDEPKLIYEVKQLLFITEKGVYRLYLDFFFSKQHLIFHEKPKFFHIRIDVKLIFSNLLGISGDWFEFSRFLHLDHNLSFKRQKGVRQLSISSLLSFVFESISEINNFLFSNVILELKRWLGPRNFA